MKLLSAFICNPNLSTDECTAYDNILCYHPGTTSKDDQMNEAGFCIALMRLQERFGVPMFDAPDVSSSSSSSADQYDSRRRSRTITTSRKRYTIVPVARETFVCVTTNRETLRPNLSTIPLGVDATGETVEGDATGNKTSSLPSSSTNRTAQHFSAVRNNRQMSLASEMPPSSPNGLEAGDGSLSRTPSCPLWDTSSIPHTNDELDEYVTEIIERLVGTTHRMFAMMFGSVQWNYERLCLLEAQERGGFKKRPKQSSTSAEDFEYNEDREEQRSSLDHVLREGFLNRLVSAIHASSSLQHCLEGSFACPAGIDMLPVGKEMHLMVSSLVAQLAASHPGAIRNTLVVQGMKMVHSTLSFEDTETMFYLMKYYNSQPPERVISSNSSSRRREESSRRALRQSTQQRGMEADVMREVEGWYSPEQILCSENRRSTFLRSSVAYSRPGEDSSPEWRRDAAHPPSASRAAQTVPNSSVVHQASSGSQEPPPSLTVADHFEYGFPFVFLGDDDPVGVYTRDLGTLRFMFLVNEKYLRITELRVAFEESMEDCLQQSPIPIQLINATVKKSNSGGFSSSPTSSGSASLSASFAGSQQRQSDIMESQFLYYYRSNAIAQVRSSIVQRLPFCKGSLVSPPPVPLPSSPSRHTSEESRNPRTANAATTTNRQSTLMRQLLSLAGSDSLMQKEGSEPVRKVLSLTERECVHLLDVLRSSVLRASAPSPSASSCTFALVRKNTWACVFAYGSRDLSCVVQNKDSFEDAEAKIDILSRLVFYYSFRPPGLS